MRVDLFDFELPPERIALRPARPRDCGAAAGRRGREIADRQVLDLPELLAARRRAGVQRHQGHSRAARRAARRGEHRRDAAQARGAARMAGVPAQRQAGAGRATRSTSATASRASVVEKTDDGSALLHFHGEEPVELLLERAGRMPLPPYIASQPRQPTRPTAPIIRRCSRARRGRSPRRPRRCISRRGCSRRSTRAASAARR